jgi:Fimbrial assembly protein (PilN)
MRPISINLASRPFYNNRLYVVAYSVSAGLLALMTGLSLYTFFSDQVSLKRFQAAEDRLQSQLLVLDRNEEAQRKVLRRLDLEEVAAQSHFANDAILERVFSWTLLFNRLERVMPPDVKLESLRPKVDGGSIHFRIIGTAKSPSDFTDFEEALLESVLFSDVYPISETISPTGRGLLFSLSFRYLPGQERLEAEEESALDQGEADTAAGAALAVESSSGPAAQGAP